MSGQKIINYVNDFSVCMLPISGQAFIHDSDLHWVMINVLLSISLSQSLMLRTEEITVKESEK